MPKLVVTLLKATDLPASDFEMMQGGKSDPYVALTLGGQTFKSSKVKKTLDPVWHPAERFEFDVIHVRKEVLKIEIFDFDTWNSDDLLGTAAVPVSRFEDTGDQIVTETLAIEVSEKLANQNRASTITLEFCLKLNEGGKRTLRLWEFESYKTGSGWKPCDSGDHAQWATFDDSRSSAQFEEVAPDIPPHHEAKGWGYSTQRGDAEGWEYSSTYTGPWSASSGTLTFVRRRLWENVCEPSA